MQYNKGILEMNKYGFYGRLTANFPSQINVDLTQICNLRCVHCPYSEFSKALKDRHSLSYDLNKKMVDEVAKYGQNTQYIRYTGNGEPLLHAQCIDILDYAVKNSNSLVTLTTNGTLLNEKNIDKLLATKLYLIDISIDANSKETYKQIRGGNFDILKKNVINLLKRRNELAGETKVVTNFIKQPLNDFEAEDFEKFWKDEGVDYVVIRKLHSAGNNKKAIADKLQNGSIRKPCLYPWERILLNAEGMLSFCPVDWTGDAVIFDYNIITIKEAWRSHKMEALRLAHLSNNFSEYKQCRNCPDWILTNWPDEGRSYADMITDFKEKED